MELRELLSMKKGTVLQKGTRKRIFLETDGIFVFYKTPSGRDVIGEISFHFAKWLKGAKVVAE